MPFSIVCNNIAAVRADAIVNAANERLAAGGGVCGAIFAAAGAGALQAACDKIGYCPTGSAVATPAFGLNARWIIHAVGPIWRGGTSGEEAALRSCYRQTLALAEKLGARSVAFPLISSGIYGYPKRAALAVATSEVRAFLADHDLDVTLVVLSRDAVPVGNELYFAVENYLDDVYVAVRETPRGRDLEQTAVFEALAEKRDAAPEPIRTSPRLDPVTGEPLVGAHAAPVMGAAHAAPATAASAADAVAPASAASATPAHAARKKKQKLKVKPSRSGISGAIESIRLMIGSLDASFSQTLLALVASRGLTDAEVCSRANLSRALFSKIRKDGGFQPSKSAALALAVALELTLDEAKDLLASAGMALSHGSKRDVIVEYFIRTGVYDVYAINEVLFAFDQPLLGL